MNATKNPFDHMLDSFREIVRQELAALKPAEPEKLLLDVNDAARLLDVPKSWLAEAARTGKVKAVRLGHYVKFRRSDLEEFIQQSKESSEGEEANDG